MSLTRTPHLPLPFVLPLLLALGAPLPLRADDPPAADAEPEQVTLDEETQTCEEPPLQVTRPSDAWRFVDLKVMKERDQQAGRDTQGYAYLRARLWHGATRSNVFVRAWIRPGEDAPEPVALATEQQAGFLKAFAEGVEVEAPRPIRVGRRVGGLLALRGTLRTTGKPHAILMAAVFRPEDRAVVTFTLECPPSALRKLSKDFKELLEKVKV